jgi:hypothetical protein
MKIKLFTLILIRIYKLIKNLLYIILQGIRKGDPLINIYNNNISLLILTLPRLKTCLRHYCFLL